MGADFVGWRGCALQARLDPDGFLGKLKLRAYKRMLEERVPEEQRASVKIEVHVSGREVRGLTYFGICAELADFERGVPECATCPLSGGAPVGCYRYVTYPIDEQAERLLFERFTSELVRAGSIADKIYRNVVAQVPAESAWHTNRGAEGGLAELARPLSFKWTTAVGVRATVDSAQLLAALFVPLTTPPVLVAYAAFFKDFVAWARERVTGQSRTLTELEAVLPILLECADRAYDNGWQVVVDG
jgi:hypothetical protein